MKTPTRLEELCSIFGWQGGTIHQCNRKIEEVLAYEAGTINVLCLEQYEYWDMLADLMAVLCEAE